MKQQDEKRNLRARDFWTSLVLIVGGLFFLWRTLQLPLTGASLGGVANIDWYESAAIVPLGIFGGILILALVLLHVSIRDGGAEQAFHSAGLGWNRREAVRLTCLALVLGFFIAGLVPRVDFIISSGLLITAMIFGFHGGIVWRMVIAAGVTACAGLYALVFYFPQSAWNAHGDDVVALVAWGLLTAVMLSVTRAQRLFRFVPVIAVLVPLLLVTAMAFGFRQNVPARGGLFFKHIEYQYYTAIKPLWAS